MKKIIAVHLLNDRSGSPFVFSQALDVLIKQGHEVHLCTTNTKGNGFLSNINGVHYHEIKYTWSENKYITLFNFIVAQIRLFFLTIQLSKNLDCVYINSVLPFGVAYAGWLLRKKVVYHVHEVSIKPELLKQFLNFTVNLTSSQNIYVSRFLELTCDHKTPSQKVIYNSLPDDFIELAQLYASHQNKPAKHNKVLMLASLKDYKGIPEFVELASKADEYQFTLVLNASKQQTDRYFANITLPKNLKIHTSQNNVHPFYLETDFVVNLSRTEEWLETFGMTILEAMIYGKPVIVPPEGGITELNENGVTGFEIEGRKTNDIYLTLQYLSTPTVYETFSEACKKRANLFLPDKFSAQIEKIF